MAGRRQFLKAALGGVAGLAGVASISACRPEEVPGVDLITGEPAGQEVPLLIGQGPEGSVVVFVPVYIGGEGPFPFALDTGASRSVVNAQLVEHLGLEATGETRPAVGVSGTTEAGELRLEQWRIGDVELPPATVAKIDLPSVPAGGADEDVQGLLGADMLSRFGSITINFDEQRMMLHRDLNGAS